MSSQQSTPRQMTPVLMDNEEVTTSTSAHESELVHPRNRLVSDVFTDSEEQRSLPSRPQSPNHAEPLERNEQPQGSHFAFKNPNLAREFHPKIDGTPVLDDWGTFGTQSAFETAELLYVKTRMSEGNIDSLMDLWNQTGDAPFSTHEDLYNAIDALSLGDIPWESFLVQYHDDEIPDPNRPRPQWMSDVHEVFYRNPRLVVRDMLMNPDFNQGMDFAPHRVFDESDNRQYDNMMSGNWVWDQADEIAEDASTHGSMFVPIILGSDKTTVSVATGHTEYYPLYLSIGNLHNNIRHAHRGGVMLIGFLAIAKTEKQYSNSAEFRRFRRQLFHTSLARILSPLQPGMSVPEVVLCADGHYRWAIYGLGPYIADYPEQVLISGIVQNWCPRCTAHKDDLDASSSIPRTTEHNKDIGELLNLGELWREYGLVGDVEPFTSEFPRANIHELLSPDLLHQLIKGTFKDHLVEWVNAYIQKKHPGAAGQAILDDIDRRMAAAPSFTDLRRFPQGRGFKQWTGDDSKALMKVYLSAIEGYVPNQMLRAIGAFLEFCYIARHDAITEKTLEDLEDALARFHRYRKVFQDEGIRAGFSLPRQHAASHYPEMIRLFGAPNGLCSSITEAKHIKAVKEPWRRSNRNKPLKQMLLTNQRLDKLAAARVYFTALGKLERSKLGTSLKMIDLKGSLDDISTDINQPRFSELVRKFLYFQLATNHSESEAESDVALSDLPLLRSLVVYLHHSASSIFFAPSDHCGIQGMRNEQIRSTYAWRKGASRQDCILVDTSGGGDKGLPMCGYTIGRALLLFSFTYAGKFCPCALVWWFVLSDDLGRRDKDTGMYLVEREYRDHQPHLAVIHTDTILRPVHLVPYFGKEPVPRDLSHDDSLNYFQLFYVNKFADHHSFELL
ncbi:hypothetical protein JOM56_015424 [Amanita muscaria]